MENLKLTLITLKVKDEIPMELELLERIFTDSLVGKIFFLVKLRFNSSEHFWSLQRLAFLILCFPSRYNHPPIVII